MGRATPDRDAAIVAAYLANERVQDIEARFGVSRSSLYLTLKRSGVPLRSDQRLENGSMADVLIAGLRQLVVMQAKEIEDLRAELDGHKRADGVREKVATRRSRRA